MRAEIINSIKENEDLIEENRWEEVYDNLDLKIHTGKFTTVLLDVEINPLLYLNYVPNNYLTGARIEEIVIPNNIKKIGRAAFYLCRDLERVKLPDGLINIGPAAFTMCDSLKSITLPSTLKSIEDNAFSANALLEEIKIPESVETISEYAFSYTSRLKRVEISSSTEVHKKAFIKSANFVLVVDGKEMTKKDYGLE